MQRPLAALVGLALLLGACTTSTPDTVPSPAPSPTPSTSSTSPELDPTAGTAGAEEPGRVAVVIAPDPPLAAAAAEIGVRGASSRLLGGVELRVATADSAPFVEDLTRFFTSEGYDLVCVVGSGAEAAVRDVASSSPSTRFCAAPASAEGMPDNVLPIDLRVEELGYLAGAALAADGLTSPAGMMVSSTWSPQRLEVGLTAGLAAGGVESPTVRAVGQIEDEEAMVEQTNAMLEAGVEGMLTFTGALDASVVSVVEEVPITEPEPSPSPTATTTQPGGTATPTEAPTTEPTESEPRYAGLVAGPEARPTEDGAPTSDQLLVILELHLEEAVLVAVTRHVEGWDTTPASVGLSEGAFRIDIGDGERARAVTDAVAGAQEGIRSGDVEVPTQ